MLAEMPLSVDQSRSPGSGGWRWYLTATTPRLQCLGQHCRHMSYPDVKRSYALKRLEG
jgi:hypothetical protein